MAPKDRDNKLLESGAIYRYKCPHINCLDEYIGESGRTFRDRLKEHLRAPSPIHHHSHSTGHPVSPQCFTIVDRESQVVTRNIEEAMYIHANDPSLNRNLGKYQLPHIWDEVLQDIPSLQLNNTALLPTPTWAKPPISIPYNKWGTCTTSFGKYSPMQGCLPSPYHPYYLYNIPTHIPNSPTPHFNGTSFSKYTLLFM